MKCNKCQTTFLIWIITLNTATSIPRQQSYTNNNELNSTHLTETEQSTLFNHSSAEQIWIHSHHNSSSIDVLQFENKTIVEPLTTNNYSEENSDDDLEFLDVHIYKVGLAEWSQGIDPSIPVLLNLMPSSNSGPALRSASINLRSRGNQQQDTIIARLAGQAAQNLMARDQQVPTPQRSTLEQLIATTHINMTVDSRTRYTNLSTEAVLDIVLLMRQDCTLQPKRIVKWVTPKRGILFECTNGVWVGTTIIKKPRPKPRPVSVEDCHEAHLRRSNPNSKTKLTIKYSNDLERQMPVMCRHQERHTNHNLIDNRIATNPTENPSNQEISSWTVIQSRTSGNTRFYRSMKAYVKGFGKLSKREYWIGLTALHEITHLRRYRLRVELTSGDNLTYVSEYDRIRVSSEKKGFRLRLGAYIQPVEGSPELSAGDVMRIHDGGRFHARDSQNYSVNCARLYLTAFWFRGCWATVNFNGPYVSESPNNTGVRWAKTSDAGIEHRAWKTEIMIQPILN